jgi:hypothetical protein
VSAPKDRWHQLADLIQDSNLPASDKSVFRFLLDKADWKSAELPAQFRPTRETIARKTSLSYSQTGYSSRHLQRHGWLAITGRTGPGHPLRYTLTAGTQCDCTGRVHVATVPTDDPRTLPTNAANAAGQVPVSTERQREGGSSKGQFEQKSTAPDWPLIRRLVRIVHTDPCGGIHREALAEQLHLPARGRVLGDALAIAYRRKQIDFCQQYVVKPVPPNGRPA